MRQVEKHHAGPRYNIPGYLFIDFNEDRKSVSLANYRQEKTTFPSSKVWSRRELKIGILEVERELNY